MTFGPFPKLHKGIRWPDTSVIEWRNLITAVETLTKMSGSGIRISMTPGSGVTFTLEPEVPVVQGTSLIEPVVLVQVPIEEELMKLIVRPVKFKGEAGSTEAGWWEWSSEKTVEARPDFGFESLDYSPFLWSNSPESPPDDPLQDPTDETTYLKLQRNPKGKDIIWYPSGGGQMQFCVVRAINEGDSNVITVQAVKNNQFVGGALDIFVWPGAKSSDYEAFVWLGSTINDETPILPAFRMFDEWFLQQYIRFTAKKISGAFQVSGCTPVERIV